jgi:hypothetical protein
MNIGIAELCNMNEVIKVFKISTRIKGRDSFLATALRREE